MADLFDNMYDLVDSLTFKLRSISPNMWPVFEITYKLFKSDAVDFLEGGWYNQLKSTPADHISRNASISRQFRLVWY